MTGRGSGGKRGQARIIWKETETGPFSSQPNPSFNRTRYGRPPWPELRYAVHSLS